MGSRPSIMGRSVAVAILVPLILVTAQNVGSESAVNLSSAIYLDEVDLGIEGIAPSPLGELVIGYGAESSIFAIDASNPLNNSKLDWEGKETFQDGDFHPGGRSALVVGDDGAVVRISMSNFSVSRVDGGFYFGQTELLSISWNGDGSWSYIGGESGLIWRARWIEEGAEVHQMEGRGGSDVNSIDCFAQWNICLVATSFDGIGVITSDHEMHWLGGVGYPWVGVACPSIYDDTCVAVSSDKNVALIEVNPYNPSVSEIGIVSLPDLEGQLNGLSFQSEGRSLISMTPFSMIEHSISLGNSYPWLENSDAIEFDSQMANGRIIGTWPTSENSGWAMTSFGGFVHFSPKEVTNDSEGILGIWVIIVVIGGAILLSLSAVASSSTKLSSWITKKIGNEEEKKRETRKSRKKSK